ncbi:hypothetical protein [Parendozoicomonas sp. Alg238-R29]|uniref:hypothetical protein n=1 Tax=Parendozoicomonas sp. Alg238-R29 TaxID=2993446 RepID=UPI00248E9F5A|nr:hypothetical protein [Parendozoicomonas sp. Alg238-R29]
MHHEYASYIEWDENIQSLVFEKQSTFESLNKSQIELLVFYLKNINNSTNGKNTSTDEIFLRNLEQLKKSDEQIKLQARSGKYAVMGVAVCVVSGMLLASSLFSFFIDKTGLGISLLVIAALLLIYSDIKLFYKSAILDKEQDRRYLLSSIRSAKSCKELQLAGFFTYTKSWNETCRSNSETLKIQNEIYEVSRKFRSALYNDPDFEFTDIQK